MVLCAGHRVRHRCLIGVLQHFGDASDTTRQPTRCCFQQSCHTTVGKRPCFLLFVESHDMYVLNNFLFDDPRCIMSYFMTLKYEIKTHVADIFLPSSPSEFCAPSSATPFQKWISPYKANAIQKNRRVLGRKDHLSSQVKNTLVDSVHQREEERRVRGRGFVVVGIAQSESWLQRTVQQAQAEWLRVETGAGEDGEVANFLLGSKKFVQVFWFALL